MILKFFDMFLKLKDLSSSEAFRVRSSTALYTVQRLKAEEIINKYMQEQKSLVETIMVLMYSPSNHQGTVNMYIQAVTFAECVFVTYPSLVWQTFSNSQCYYVKSTAWLNELSKFYHPSLTTNGGSILWCSVVEYSTLWVHEIFFCVRSVHLLKWAQRYCVYCVTSIFT